MAEALRAPLDVIVVRKLGVPWQPQLAFGAIGEDGVRVLNPEVASRIASADAERVEREERAKLDRRVRLLRGGLPRTQRTGRTAVLLDEGVATGATARAGMSGRSGAACHG